MDIFQDALLGGMFLGGCRYFPRGEREAAYDELVLFFGKTRKELKLVTGDLNQEFYERDYLISTWKGLLDNGVHISAVLSGQPAKGSGKVGFRKNHERMHDLKEEYPDNLHIYCAPKRLSSHYGIADGKHVFFEGAHEPHNERDVYFEYNSKMLASRLDKMFCSIVPMLPEIVHSCRESILTGLSK